MKEIMVNGEKRRNMIFEIIFMPKLKPFCIAPMFCFLS